MQRPIISIVYHDSTGDTIMLARTIGEHLCGLGATVHYVEVAAAKDKLELLHGSDLLLFGANTHFGNISAGFQQFIESTADFWYQQPWKDKLAAGFTLSCGCSDDKLNTLIALSLFAAKHGMIWVSLGILPRFLHGEQTEGQNRLASYLGLMAQSNLEQSEHSFPAGDLLTAELFARRLYTIATKFLNIHS